MNEPRRVLIIGCGYLGSRIGKLLLEQGMSVTATTASPERISELEALGFQGVHLDLSKPEESPAWEQAYCALVYSVAPSHGGDPWLCFHDGALDCARRFRKLRSAPPGRLIYISSTGIYHQKDGSVVNEESPAEPAGERPRIIRTAEEDLLLLSSREDLSLVVLRLAGIYGPGRSPIDWIREPWRKKRGLKGGRDAFLNLIRVEDAAQAVCLALDRARSGEIYLVVDNEPAPRREIYGFAARYAGLPPPDLPLIPDDLGKRCSNEKAKAELGFQPAYPTYREGLGTL